MSLTEYFSDISIIIDEYSKTNLITSSEVITDFRSEKTGIIKGKVTFIDDSSLHFTEYLDARNGTEKLSYSFHYQRQDGELIFRYDNARHRPQLIFAYHKHLPNGEIIDSEIPEFKQVLEEAIVNLV